MPEVREVKNKINRVLDRLDQGEELISGYMRVGDQFCVLGLFADESDQGKWSDEDLLIKSYKPRLTLKNLLKYGCHNYPQTFQLNKSLVAYYGLRDSSISFSFDILNPELRHLVLSLKCHNTLVSVNDHMIAMGYSNKIINKTLADIIRSGAIFK